MDLDLSGSVTRSNVTDADDIVALKRVLNRLGYYKPFPKIGMNEFTDEGVFTAIKAFQKDHDVFVNGQIRPGDGTERALNAALDYAGDDGHYIWRTVQDDHVRADHAARAGRVFSWADHPQPGDEFGCRCWAEMAQDSVDLSGIYDPPIKPVYPEVLLVPALRLGAYFSRDFLALLPRILRQNESTILSQTQKENLARFVLKRCPLMQRSLLRLLNALME